MSVIVDGNIIPEDEFTADLIGVRNPVCERLQRYHQAMGFQFKWKQALGQFLASSDCAPCLPGDGRSNFRGFRVTGNRHVLFQGLGLVTDRCDLLAKIIV